MKINWSGVMKFTLLEYIRRVARAGVLVNLILLLIIDARAIDSDSDSSSSGIDFNNLGDNFSYTYTQTEGERATFLDANMADFPEPRNHSRETITNNPPSEPSSIRVGENSGARRQTDRIIRFGRLSEDNTSNQTQEGNNSNQVRDNSFQNIFQITDPEISRTPRSLRSSSNFPNFNSRQASHNSRSNADSNPPSQFTSDNSAAAAAASAGGGNGWQRNSLGTFGGAQLDPGDFETGDAADADNGSEITQVNPHNIFYMAFGEIGETIRQGNEIDPPESIGDESTQEDQNDEEPGEDNASTDSDTDRNHRRAVIHPDGNITRSFARNLFGQYRAPADEDFAPVEDYVLQENYYNNPSGDIEGEEENPTGSKEDLFRETFEKYKNDPNFQKKVIQVQNRYLASKLRRTEAELAKEKNKEKSVLNLRNEINRLERQINAKKNKIAKLEFENGSYHDQNSRMRNLERENENLRRNNQDLSDNNFYLRRTPNLELNQLRQKLEEKNREINSLKRKLNRRGSDDFFSNSQPNSQNKSTKAEQPLEGILENDDILENELDMKLDKLGYNNGFLTKSKVDTGISGGSYKYTTGAELWFKLLGGKRVNFDREAWLYKSSYYVGGLIGFDYHFNDNLMCGVSLSGMDLTKDGVSKNIPAYKGNKFNKNFYLNWYFDKDMPLYCRFDINHASSNFDVVNSSNEKIPIYNSAITLKPEFGYEFNTLNYQITPFFSFKIHTSSQEVNSNAYPPEVITPMDPGSSYETLNKTLGVNIKTIYVFDDITLYPMTRISYSFVDSEHDKRMGSLYIEPPFIIGEGSNFGDGSAKTMQEAGRPKSYTTISFGCFSDLQRLSIDSTLNIKFANKHNYSIGGSIKISLFL